MAEVNARFQTSDGSAIMIILELVLLALVFMATIALVQAVRKVPVQYAKRIIGNKQYGGVRQYIPLKMNAANVMPIIFAQALMFIPMLFTKIAPGFAGAFAGVSLDTLKQIESHLLMRHYDGLMKTGRIQGRH